MTNERTIKVTGKGNLKVRPDMTRITMTLEGQAKEYDKILELSSKETGMLKDLLEKQSFDKSDVKTPNYKVDTKYESYKTATGNWIERFIGYTYKHVVKVEFDSDNARLGKILYALANAKDIHPEFRISYTVKDKEASKNLLLGKAIEDAKSKATILTSAAGITLKDIKTIDYSWGEIAFESSPMRGAMLCESMRKAGDSLDMDIEPDDIEVSDTVTVVWEIA